MRKSKRIEKHTKIEYVKLALKYGDQRVSDLSGYAKETIARWRRDLYPNSGTVKNHMNSGDLKNDALVSASLPVSVDSGSNTGDTHINVDGEDWEMPNRAYERYNWIRSPEVVSDICEQLYQLPDNLKPQSKDFLFKSIQAALENAALATFIASGGILPEKIKHNSSTMPLETKNEAEKTTTDKIWSSEYVLAAVSDQCVYDYKELEASDWYGKDKGIYRYPDNFPELVWNAWLDKIHEKLGEYLDHSSRIYDIDYACKIFPNTNNLNENMSEDDYIRLHIATKVHASETNQSVQPQNIQNELLGALKYFPKDRQIDAEVHAPSKDLTIKIEYRKHDTGEYFVYAYTEATCMEDVQNKLFSDIDYNMYTTNDEDAMPCIDQIENVFYKYDNSAVKQFESVIPLELKETLAQI